MSKSEVERFAKDLKTKPVVLEKPLPLKTLCNALEEGFER